MGIPVTPHKTKTPLVINPNAMLPLPLAAQGFQTVAGRRCQIAQLGSAVQLAKLSPGDPFNGPKTATRLPMVKSLGFRTTERPDHLGIVSRSAFNVKRYMQGLQSADLRVFPPESQPFFRPSGAASRTTLTHGSRRAAFLRRSAAIEADHRTHRCARLGRDNSRTRC